MRLPDPGAGYSAALERARNRVLEQADLENHKRNRDVEIGQGRLILTDESTGTRHEIYVDEGAIGLREVGGIDVSVDADIRHAERVVLSSYGDTVSVADKAKSLNKFGRNRAVGTSWETVAELQGTNANENFVSTNLIDTVTSDDAADTSITFVVEGHTIDGSGNLTFVSQEVTTNASDGRTEVSLTTPMARANRAYVKDSGTFDSPQDKPAGNVYFFDGTTASTNGVPDSASATKLLIVADEGQTEKCATSISSADYWFISYFGAAIAGASPTATVVTVRMEQRSVSDGGVWRPFGRDISLKPDVNGITFEFSPFLIVRKNCDVRVRAICDTGTAEIYAEMGGYLAAVQ